jgi:hypothetical protein
MVRCGRLRSGVRLELSATRRAQRSMSAFCKAELAKRTRIAESDFN